MNDFRPGVVIDEPQSLAILIAAIDEGLIDDPKQFDYCPSSQARNLGMSALELQGLLKQGLEQLVVGGRLFLPSTPPYVRDKWQGRLFDEGIIVKAEPFDCPSNPPELNIDLLSGMLLARGNRDLANEREILRRIDEYLEADAAWNEAFAPDSPISMAEALGKEIASAISMDDSAFPQRAIYQRYNKAILDVRPIQSVFETAQYIIERSLAVGAYSSLPYVRVSDAPALHRSPGANILPVNVELLNIIDNEIGTIPIGRNLSATLQLAAISEAVHFRRKLFDWTTLISTTNGQEFERIRKELLASKKAIPLANMHGAEGEFCTVIGFATALGGIAGLAANIGPIISAIGGAASVLGGTFLAAQYLQKLRAGRWAMFLRKAR